MTRSEWNDSMQRYMHRTDIAADLDDIWEQAQNMFFNAWLRKDGRDEYPTDDELLAAAPSAMLHAGLTYLHELAQDDVGLQRENSRFALAVDAFAMNYSLRNSDAFAIAPQYNEGTT